MELLRHVVVLLHIVGFAVTFGGWAAEAAARRYRTARLMDYGLLLSLLSGVVLAAPWPAGIVLNYPKIGIKLVILVVIGGLVGMGNARQRRTGDALPRALFASIGMLSLAAAAIAVLWR
ncbi:Fe-S protein [Mycobacteriaceae bacterium 1482268.1]|nr:Fe-S protein [Mycobacteriaceae bacterium 1482268.1]